MLHQPLYPSVLASHHCSWEAQAWFVPISPARNTDVTKGHTLSVQEKHCSAWGQPRAAGPDLSPRAQRAEDAVPKLQSLGEDGRRLGAASLPGAGTPPPFAMVFPRALAVTFQIQLPLIGRQDSAVRRHQHRG